MAEIRLNQGKSKATLTDTHKIVVQPTTGDDEYTDLPDIKTHLGVPVKATGAETDTGTDDAKFTTAKALKDSHNVPSIAPGTSGNVLTSDGTDWISVAPSGGGGSIRYSHYESGVITSGLKIEIPIREAFTASKVTISSSLLPTGSSIKVDVRKNGNTSTDSIFTSDTPAEITTSQTEANGLYPDDVTTIDNGTFASGDTMVITVTQVGSTIAGADLKVIVFD